MACHTADANPEVAGVPEERADAPVATGPDLQHVAAAVPEVTGTDLQGVTIAVAGEEADTPTVTGPDLHEIPTASAEKAGTPVVIEERSHTRFNAWWNKRLLYDGEIEQGRFLNFEAPGNELPEGVVAKEVHVLATQLLLAAVVALQFVPFGLFPGRPLPEAAWWQRVLHIVVMTVVGTFGFSVWFLFFDLAVFKDARLVGAITVRYVLPCVIIHTAVVEGTGAKVELYPIYLVAFTLATTLIFPLFEVMRAGLGEPWPWLKGPGWPSWPKAMGALCILVPTNGIQIAFFYSLVDMMVIQSGGGMVKGLRPIFFVAARSVALLTLKLGLSNARLPYTHLRAPPYFCLMVGQLSATTATGCESWSALANVLIIDWAVFGVGLARHTTCGNKLAPLAWLRERLRPGRLSLQPLPGMAKEEAQAYVDFVKGLMTTTALLCALLLYPFAWAPSEGLNNIAKFYFPRGRTSLSFLSAMFASTYLQDRVMAYLLKQKHGYTFSRLFGKVHSKTTLVNVFAVTIPSVFVNALFIHIIFIAKLEGLPPFN